MTGEDAITTETLLDILKQTARARGAGGEDAITTETLDRIKRLREVGAYSDDDLKDVAAILNPNEHRFTGIAMSPVLRQLLLKEFMSLVISETWIRRGSTWHPWDGVVSVSGDRPDAMAGLPDGAQKIALVDALGSIVTANTEYDLTLALGDEWTLTGVRVLRVGVVEESSQVVTVVRDKQTIGQDFNYVTLTGAEKGNTHSNVRPKIKCNFTGTVVIYTSYWYSQKK